ncbi:MAG: class I SAM-dependent methyltransferase [Bacteroidetes bacterium]|nr:class I SAM-dependent methyltransferase [Bacteroidota bacterium]
MGRKEEIDRIKAVYSKRDKQVNIVPGHYQQAVKKEREELYRKRIERTGTDTATLKLLEIGAGTGTNIKFLKTLGFKDENIWANELMPVRVEQLRAALPDIHVLEGDALDINTELEFDVILQSTVFTSILDTAFKQGLASKMLGLLKPGGMILWYDFRFNNPSNKNVKGIDKREIRQLFGDGLKYEFYNITLAPPVGRRVGSMYGFINMFFPFLRSHLVAVIRN